MGDWDPFADPAEQVEEPAKVVAVASAAVVDVGKPKLDPTVLASEGSRQQASAANSEGLAVGKPEVRPPAAATDRSPLSSSADVSKERSGLLRWTGDPVQKAKDVEVPVLSAEAEARLKDQDKKAIVLEVQRLKAAKQLAVQEEEFEEAAVLKRRIGVLEASLGGTVPSTPAASGVVPTRAMPVAVKEPEPASQTLKPAAGQFSGREALRELPSDKLKLCAEERDFIAKSKAAMMDRSVTDDTVNGVPQWAYDKAKKEGFAAVQTDRPSELAYKFKGQIEDEKWEPGVDFQTKVIVQVPVEVAFGFIVSPETARGAPDQGPMLSVGPGANISHHASGTAQLTELLGSEIRENESVSFRIAVVKPKVPGKVKLAAAQTVTTKDPFKRRPFYVFKSLWKLRSLPAGGTEVTRVVREFKQYELPDFDALMAVSRSLEVESEQIRTSWSVTVAVQHERRPATQRAGAGPQAAQQIAKRAVTDGEMYSASFVVSAGVDHAFGAMLSNELLYEYHWGLGDDSFLRLDEQQVLIRQINGIVLLVTARGRDRELTLVTVAHIAGKGLREAKGVTTARQVLADPFYRVTTIWVFSPQGEGETCIRRTMRGFKQEGHAELKDLASVLTEAADGENRKLVQAFAALAGRQGHMPARPPTSMSTRAKYAMRKMPELLDHAAKNHVLEVREMLEVKGADPNYVHVRQDSWAMSDTLLIFYEEVTPLMAAAENGATDAIKVLFDHPQLDANLCCCAYNDMEIYNYYTAYDMTISRRQPHAAALLRARGVLPASSEHVYKPLFDEDRARPARGDAEDGEEEESAEAESEMPSLPTSNNPRLVSQIRAVAETLRASRRQPAEARARIFRSLAAEWHPDKQRPEKGGTELATRIFQWLQSAKAWYLEADVDGEVENQALADLPDTPDRPTAPKTAEQFRNASGSVFSVW